MTKTLRLLTALALVAVAVGAGCGTGAGSGSGTDTAKLAPASSFVYAEATIDPSGGQQAAMRSILGDLPGSGAPEQRLDNLLEEASRADHSRVDYLKDVKPWLGDKVAVFAAPPRSGSASPAWAIVVATTDEAKARDAIEKAKRPGDEQRRYNGTGYTVDADGTATATVGGFFLAGSESGLKAAIDASKGGSLSASDRYRQATANASGDRIALVYEDTGGLLQMLASSSGQSLGPAAPFVGRLFGGKPVVATVRAEQQALVIDGSILPSGTGLDLSGKSTPLLGELPGDSWLAVGSSDVGTALKNMIGLVAGAVGGEQALDRQLRSATGLDLQRDVLGWIGDAAVFVRGDSKQTIGGGVLIQSKDPAASERALTKLAALAARTGGGRLVSAASVAGAQGYRLRLKGAPQAVYAVQKGDRVAITYGLKAASDALGGAGGGLANANGLAGSAHKLGDEYAPSLYLSVPPIVRLAESLGASGRGYEKAKPYLTILDYVIAGSTSGDGAASRTRIGFKPHD